MNCLAIHQHENAFPSMNCHGNSSARQFIICITVTGDRHGNEGSLENGVREQARRRRSYARRGPSHDGETTAQHIVGGPDRAIVRARACCLSITLCVSLWQKGPLHVRSNAYAWRDIVHPMAYVAYPIHVLRRTDARICSTPKLKFVGLSILLRAGSQLHEVDDSRVSLRPRREVLVRGGPPTPVWELIHC